MGIEPPSAAYGTQAIPLVTPPTPPSNAPAYQEEGEVKSKTRALIVLVVVMLIIAGAGICIAWLGLIRFGTPSLSKAVVAAEIDEKTKEPKKSVEEFTDEDKKIYCTALVRGFTDTRLAARWFYGDTEVGELKGALGSLASGGTTNFIASSGYVAFYMERPEGGWSSGKYRVELYLDGEEAAKKTFSIEAREIELDEDLSIFEDADGRFSVSYPSSWSRASESSLEEDVLVGFVGPDTDGFSPKFVVLTSSQPMDINALNAELEAEGAPEGELFQETTVGGREALVRTFEWSYQTEEGEPVDLKTIQALVEDDGVVYGIHCHATADSFSRYKSTFDTIIDSFEVGGQSSVPSNPTLEPEIPFPPEYSPENLPEGWDELPDLPGEIPDFPGVTPDFPGATPRSPGEIPGFPGETPGI